MYDAQSEENYYPLTPKLLAAHPFKLLRVRPFLFLFWGLFFTHKPITLNYPLFVFVGSLSLIMRIAA